MNEKIIQGTLAAMLFATGSAAQADDPYNLQITGTILSKTCELSSASKNQTVQLGSINSAWLARTQAGPRYEPFTLELENCGKLASHISVTFSGSASAQNPALLAITAGPDNAQGVAIELYDRDKTPLALNTEGDATPLTASQPSVTLAFYARYVTDGTPLRAGAANATATFVLRYE